MEDTGSHSSLGMVINRTMDITKIMGMPMEMTGVMMTAKMITGSMAMVTMIAVIIVTAEGNMKGTTAAGSMHVFPSGLDNLPVFNK